jgi:excisionase family DNA binding protein
MEEGLTTRALAQRFGVHQRTVWQALKEAGATAPRRGSWCKPRWPEHIDREELQQLYVEQGLTVQAVAERLGVADKTVSRALAGYGIPVDRGRRQRRRPSREVLVDLCMNQGLTTADLAERFGVHRRTPWHWLADEGIPAPGRRRRVPNTMERRREMKPVLPAVIASIPTVVPAAIPKRASEELLTPAEVAQVFGVDPKTITRWARQGRIAAHRTFGGHRRFSVAEVTRCATELLEGGRVDGNR